MKLKQYIENLNKFAEENPEALEYVVITAIDDEGNGFNLVHFTPSKGVYVEGEFYNKPEEWGYSQEDINAVCIN